MRSHWRLHANYTYYWQREGGAGLDAPGSFETTWPFPHHQAQLRSTWDLNRRTSLDVSLYAVSRLGEISVPGYLRPDIRLAWRMGEFAEWSFGVQDAFREQRVEFRSEDYVRNSEPGRRFYVKFLWGR